MAIIFNKKAMGIGILLTIIIGALLMIALLVFVFKGRLGLSIFDTTVRLDPDSVMNDAKEAFDSEYYDEAIRLYREFLSKFPKHKDAFKAKFQIGECYYAMDQEAYKATGNHDIELLDKALIEYKMVLEYDLTSEWENKVEDMIQIIEDAKWQEARKLFSGASL